MSNNFFFANESLFFKAQEQQFFTKIFFVVYCNNKKYVKQSSSSQCFNKILTRWRNSYFQNLVRIFNVEKFFKSSVVIENDDFDDVNNVVFGIRIRSDFVDRKFVGQSVVDKLLVGRFRRKNPR